MAVVLETSIGDITIDLYTEERPICCKNFLKLCKIKYYNFCLFHSVQSGFTAQTGDPTGTGRGGESIFSKLYGEQAKFFEMESKPRIKHTKVGTISMVNNGNGMHASQFFITLAADLDYLDATHTVFGEVAEGFDIIEKLNEVITDEEHIPYRDIRILHTVVLDDPYDDPAGLGEYIPDRSPEPNKELLKSLRIGMDEELDQNAGKTEAEIEEATKAHEAKANAEVLEMLGDLPDAQVEAPDNVLFVCKLNPVTTGEDLEIIFSRFGKINSCEVIKDQKTDESLQYAFIEFDTPAECEAAYFKMDNVLIDDRRIHVDFSQSVSKLRKGYKSSKKDDYDDDDRPNFKIKNLDKVDDRYQLVFDEEQAVKKKKKKRKQSDDSEEEDYRSKKNKGSRRERSQSLDSNERQKSLSPVHKFRSKKREDVSISPDYKSSSREVNHRNRYRSRSRDRTTRHRSRSRDRKKRDRSRSIDRKKRDRSRSRDRTTRHRSRSRDRKYRDRSRSRDRYNRDRSRDRYNRHRSRSRDRKNRHRSRSRDR